MNFSLIFSSIALVSGIVFLRYAKPRYLIWLVVILALTVATEGLVENIHKIPSLTRRVNVVYNIFSLVNAYILFFIFHKILIKNKIKKYIIPLCILIQLCACSEIGLNNSWNILITFTLRLFCIIIIFYNIKI